MSITELGPGQPRSGDEAIAGFMGPGDKFMGNYPWESLVRYSIDPLDSNDDVGQAVRRFRGSARYDSVKVIPAFDMRTGRALEGMWGIIAHQRPEWTGTPSLPWLATKLGK